MHCSFDSLMQVTIKVITGLQSSGWQWQNSSTVHGMLAIFTRPFILDGLASLLSLLASKTTRSKVNMAVTNPTEHIS